MKICIVPECGNLVEGNTHRCASHNQMARRKERERKKEAEKRDQLLLIRCETTIATYKLAKTKKAIKKVSDKRKEINKEYFKLVEQFKHDNPHCAAKVNDYCTGQTDDPHHTRGRGKYLLDVTTWLPVCRSCHIFITNNPTIAMQKGWSESRLATIKQTI